jgi:CBS domain containing-hemolysin-like protein
MRRALSCITQRSCLIIGGFLDTIGHSKLLARIVDKIVTNCQSRKKKSIILQQAVLLLTAMHILYIFIFWIKFGKAPARARACGACFTRSFIFSAVLLTDAHIYFGEKVGKKLGKARARACARLFAHTTAGTRYRARIIAGPLRRAFELYSATRQYQFPVFSRSCSQY